MNSINAKAKDLFMQAYNGQTNIMTPDVLAYGFRGKGKFAYEISYGNFGGDNLYGVTVLVLRSTGYEKSPDLSKCLFSRKDAEDYLRSLSEE